VPVTTDKRPYLRGLVLRPGTHVLRRGATELQVGLDPRRAVVLPDRPEVRTLLEALANPVAEPSAEYDVGALALLADNGLLVDSGRLLPLAGHRPGNDSPAVLPRTEVAALAARAGDRAGDLVAARRATLVEVVPLGSPDAHAVSTHAVGMLSDAGVTARLLPRDSAPAARASSNPTVALLVCVGEPSREEVDDWMRAGVPHLLLRLVEGDAVVGPFVLPGETTCLRCVDAHHTDHDPAWPLLLTQYASAVTQGRPDSLTEPVDGLLCRLVTSWAAREVVSYAEGRAPATASATVRLDPDLTALETHAWPRHPACGCSWA
jgi:bacteriocin biosynthesis cyclodehydratase domain-containing protein